MNSFFERIGDIGQRLGLLDERLGKLVPPPSRLMHTGQPPALIHLRQTATASVAVHLSRHAMSPLSEAKRCLDVPGVDPAGWKGMPSPNEKGS